MAGVVLDASALIAMLKDEPGGAGVAAIVDTAVMSVVNYSEVVSHYVRTGAELAQVEDMLRPLPVALVDADQTLARMAGAIAHITRSSGLSLGDRFCLALAQREGLPALTADRDWLKIAAAVGVDVRTIR